MWKGVFQHLGKDPITETKEELSEKGGFTWLSTVEIEDSELDRQRCWQRPFSFREVHEGFAIDRERERHGSRENFSEMLFDELDGGGAHAVTSHPGSGKSTICKTVATRWYDRDDLGQVFYMVSGEGEEISEPTVFGELIENGKRIDPVLIVVEDAVRRDAAPIFETILEYLNDEGISFLLDAHEHEWDPKSYEEDVLQTLVERPDSTYWREITDLRNEIDRHDMPPLDVHEVERVIERFKEVTGREVREDAQQILRHIRLEEEDVLAGDRHSGKWPSPMLLLTYHFPIGEGKRGDDEPSPSREGDKEKEPSSALEGNVIEVLQTIEDTDPELLDIETDDLFQEVALMVNILNASSIGVYEELLYTLADTDEECYAIEICTAELDGKVLFGRSSGTHYWSNYPLWSELYLERFLVRNRDRERWARKRFEKYVNALFRVVNEDSRRERIQRELG